jgi:spermidine/putrescine transport system substrate-binding protein
MTMRRLIAVLVIALLLLAGCSDGSGDTTRETKVSYPTAITVYMPIGYVDTGVLRDFEKEFNVGVVLKEFDSNEEMYDDIRKTSEYDVLVPSDYMIDRLIQEGRLAKLDHGKLPNMSYIARQYMGQDYDRGNDYNVPYMTGTLGILYNRRALQISSWRDMFGTKGILMVDSERDVIGVALEMLGYSMNSADEGELEAARQVLQGAKSNIGGFYDSTDIVDMITAQEAFIGVVYSGDGKLATDLNLNLEYIIPEEGGNKWTDAFVIPANSGHIDLAHEFINFMCRPNIAIRNMSCIGYTSPIQDAWSEFAGNKIMFPSDEDLARCETFTYSEKSADKYHRVWKDIRG